MTYVEKQSVSEGWTGKSCISGLAVSRDIFLASDAESNSIKIFDRETFKAKALFVLDGTPKGVVSMGKNANVFALTFPDEEYTPKIFIVIDDKKLEIQHRIQDRLKVEKHCQGIDYSSTLKGFALSFDGSDAGVKLISEDGTETHSIRNKDEAEQLFNRPLFVRFGLLGDRNVIYVSDHYLGTLSCFHIHGKRLTNLFVKTFDNLLVPRDIVVFSDGKLLVCGQNSQNVCLVSSDGENCNTIISGSFERPRAMAFIERDSEENGILLVCQFTLDKHQSTFQAIKVFQKQV